MIKGRVAVTRWIVTRMDTSRPTSRVEVPMPIGPSTEDGLVINIISDTGVPLVRTTLEIKTAIALRDALNKEFPPNG